jgi:putative ABC transport system permease protein
MITIALAVGVNLGIFTVTQTILFHSLGVPEADRLVYYTSGIGEDNRPVFSGPGYEALRANAATKDVLAWESNIFLLHTQEGAERLNGAFVTGNAFSVFRLKPSLGRFFQESDDAPGGGKDGWAAVLGYSYWKTHFGANPAVIGQIITVDNAPVHIVGVLPREFAGLSPLSPADILLPRHFQAVSSPEENRFAKPNYFEWLVFGRLPEGVSIQSVQADLKAIEPSFRRMADPKGEMYTGSLFSNTPPGSLLNVQDGRLGANFELKTLRTPLMEMEALAVIVFLFCCCNLSLLFVGRASREAHNAAIRMALGARLGHEVRFAMLEATALASIGSLMAIPIAWGTARIFSRAIQSIPGFDIFPTISPNYSLLSIAIGISLAIACLSSAGAILWQGRKRSSINLKEGRVATTSRSRNWIIGFEVFASILLVTAVVVDGIGFQKLSHMPSGFGTGSAVTTSIDIKADSSKAADGTIKETANEKLRRILDQIESSPGVQSVATMNVPPLEGLSTSGTVEAHGADGALRKQQVWPADVSVGYFQTIGTRIVRGRDFTKDDLTGDPVCILSSRAAAILFLRENPVGDFLYRGTTKSCRVVGLAEDAHLTSMSNPADIAVYRLSNEPFQNVVVRAASSSLAIQAVRNAVHTIAPESIEDKIETIQEHIDDDLRLFRVITLSGILCAGIAAMILGVGFFGILSLQVSERKREIGIQIALGANRTQVCVSVMKKLRRAVLIGLAFGSGAALLAAVSLAEVYGLSAGFVIGGFLGSLVLLGILLAAAASVPLRRALAVSPMECLNSE